MKYNRSFLSRWRILPQVLYTNFRKVYPNMSEDCFIKWFCVERYWGNQIINVCVKHHQLSFDFRRNWIADMINPNRMK
jgi:hypothetical protein